MTMTIPNTFVGDTYLSATKMDGNFSYIKTYLNGGIAAADISATAGIRPTQLAENCSVDSICMASAGTITFPVLNPVEIAEISVAMNKSDTAYGTATLNIFDLNNYKIIVRVTRCDDPASFGSGYSQLSPRVPLASGFYAINLTLSANVPYAVARVGLIQKHGKR